MNRNTNTTGARAMSRAPRTSPSPRTVAVIGAGNVGLCTAWFLQERGIEVTVFDSVGPAAGSSWGNAGWITPTLSTPLPEPSVLAYGIRKLFAPSSPVYIPPSAALDPGLVRFLVRFARNSTPGRWRTAMGELARINRHALDAFDRLAEGSGADLAACLHPAEPFIVGYTDPVDTRTLLEEGEQIAGAGQTVRIERLPIDEARSMAPILSPRITAALRLQGQRFIHPPAFAEALAASVEERGGAIRTGVTVQAVRDRGTCVGVVGEASPAPASDGGDSKDRRGSRESRGTGTDRVPRHDTDRRVDEQFDAAVIADGATLNGLADRFGVRAQVRAGRGYSFAVPVEHMPPGPVYFPVTRVACTPLRGRRTGDRQTGARQTGDRQTAGRQTGDRLRIAGMMEFRPPHAPLDPRRIAAIVDSVRPLLSGANLDDRVDEWVGSRPCTADGLPLIGPTGSPRVFVAGGHGMWGMTLGPATGELLAAGISEGAMPEDLHPFDPLR